MKGCVRVAAGVLVAVILFAIAAPARADKKEFLNSRKLYSALFFGTGVIFLKESYDARRDANDSYDLYKKATTAQSAREFYDESRRNDTKSAILLGAGAGLLAYSVHLYLSEKKENLPPARVQNGLVEVKGVALDVTGDPLTRRMQVQLKRGF